MIQHNMSNEDIVKHTYDLIFSENPIYIFSEKNRAFQLETNYSQLASCIFRCSIDQLKYII